MNAVQFLLQVAVFNNDIIWIGMMFPYLQVSFIFILKVSESSDWGVSYENDFLVYTLTEVNNQMDMQQTVWNQTSCNHFKLVFTFIKKKHLSIPWFFYFVCIFLRSMIRIYSFFLVLVIVANACNTLHPARQEQYYRKAIENSMYATPQKTRKLIEITKKTEIEQNRHGYFNNLKEIIQNQNL